MPFNARKAAQTIAYFAIKNGRAPLNVLKAVKLVYLADRRSLEECGFPIQDDVHVSMPHGPVNSYTYSHINGEHDLSKCGWSDFLEDRENHEIALTNPSTSTQALDELSRADFECLDKVWGDFGHMGPFELRDWTHEKKNIPEWEDPGNGAKDIPLERILRVLGVKDSEAQAGLIAEFRKIDSIFDSLQS